MTRPDPNAPDSGANQDDAVWLDLVARLEDRDPDAGTGTPGAGHTGDSATAGAETDGTGTAGTAGTAGAETDGTGTADPAAPRPFSDFDPLGLAVGAPVELSAEERQARGRSGTNSGGAADAAVPAEASPGHASPGPRDYEAADDDPLGPGEFVPEEPPSLAGADPLTVLAWLGAVGAPIALVMSAMFWRSAPLLAVLGMVAAFAASVVILIMKLPGEKDEHDDGARI